MHKTELPNSSAARKGFQFYVPIKFQNVIRISRVSEKITGLEEQRLEAEIRKCVYDFGHDSYSCSAVRTSRLPVPDKKRNLIIIRLVNNT